MLFLSRFIHGSIFAVCAACIMTFSWNAEAAGKRKVTTFEYDTLGRQIKAQVFDDVGGALISESEKIYDSHNNVLEEKQNRVTYDLGIALPGIAYNELKSQKAFEDTTWPTRPTKIYNPRYPYDFSLPATNAINVTADLHAEQFFYDGTTGQVEFSFNSAYYCTDIPDTWISYQDTSMVVSGLERSGSALADITIQSYPRCRAAITEYTVNGGVSQPTRVRTSNLMAYGRDIYDATIFSESVWIETEIDYYPIVASMSDVNTNGEIREVKTGLTGEFLQLVNQYFWDKIGNLKQILTPNADGIPARSTFAEYDGLRRITGFLGPDGAEKSYVYDDLGRLTDTSTRISGGEWVTQSATHFANGQIHEIIDADGDKTTYSYDAAGRLDVAEDGAGRKTKTVYYANGQTKCTIRGYDSPLTIPYAMYDYAADGQVKAMRPAKGIGLDHASQPTDCTISSSDYDTTYAFDGYRRIFETVFPQGDEPSGDPMLTDASWPQGADHSYTRQWLDQAGNVTQRRTRAGHLIYEYYDNNNFAYNRTTPEGRYTYVTTGNGTPIHAEHRPKVGGSFDLYQRRYISTPLDALGRGLGETYIEGHVATKALESPFVNVAYDGAGQQSRLDYFEGASITYDYDPAGRMELVHFSHDGTNFEQIAGFAYDLMGRRKTSVLGYKLHNGVRVPAAIQSFVYDADSDLKSLSVGWSPDSATLDGFNYLYDQDGSGKMIAAYADNPVLAAFNWRHNPDEDKTETYNGTLAQNAANALDQYDQVNMGDGNGMQDQDYDLAGNLISDGLGRTYQYNSENQLVRATGTAIGDIFDVGYRYDAAGRRSHTIDYDSQAETFHMHWGQMEIGDYAITRESGFDNGKVTDYMRVFQIVLGSGVDERIAYYDANGDELSFYQTNHQGSVVALTDEDGALRPLTDGGRYVYTPYGRDAYADDSVNAVSTTGNPYRFTGRRLDAQTGLYYYRARYYDTRSGRFLQTDPIGYEDQMNLYAYVGNDPKNATDPSGEVAVECVIIDDGQAVCKRRGSNFIMSSLAFYRADMNGNLHMVGQPIIFMGAPSTTDMFGILESKNAEKDRKKKKKEAKEKKRKAKKAKRHLKSKKRNAFKNWFHRAFKSGGGVTPGGDDERNPDGDDEELADAWDEWNSMSDTEKELWGPHPR